MQDDKKSFMLLGIKDGQSPCKKASYEFTIKTWLETNNYHSQLEFNLKNLNKNLLEKT
jgi:hypothetical protein